MHARRREYQFPQFVPDDGPLQLKDYRGALQKKAETLCKRIFNDGTDLAPCVQELKPAIDCVVRSKEHMMGTLQDSIRLCRFEIALMKEELGKHYSSSLLTSSQAFKQIDAALKEIHNQPKSFV